MVAHLAFDWGQKSVTPADGDRVDIGVPLSTDALGDGAIEIMRSRLARSLRADNVEVHRDRDSVYVQIFGCSVGVNDSEDDAALLLEVQADAVVASVRADALIGWTVGDEIVLGFRRFNA